MKVAKATYTAFTKAAEEGFRSGVTVAFTLLPPYVLFTGGWFRKKQEEEEKSRLNIRGLMAFDRGVGRSTLFLVSFILFMPRKGRRKRPYWRGGLFSLSLVTVELSALCLT